MGHLFYIACKIVSGSCVQLIHAFSTVTESDKQTKLFSSPLKRTEGKQLQNLT